MIDVLISLHRGYGLGDAVQMSAVLRHVAKYRPEWRVWYRGEHNIGRGLVHQVLSYQDELPHIDAEVLICLYDTWANWGDRPNTRVSSALHEHFGLPWDRECGRYQVNWSREVWYAAREFIIDREAVRPKLHPVPGVVAIHHQGNSDKSKKDLSNEQMLDVHAHVLKLNGLPLILGSNREWGWNAEMVCAVISQCAAFVGIDSGPGKCASATDTPALITWTGHHPAPFHDPAPNTTHLVPQGYHGLEPVCNDAGVIQWFEENYNVRHYADDPVVEIKRWLTETLGGGGNGVRSTSSADSRVLRGARVDAQARDA